MARKKDWRVHYGRYPGPGENHTRSKPFDTEDEALSWAISWMKNEGAEVDAVAHVSHVTQTRRDLPDLDPVPPSHRLMWADEVTLVKRTWPSISRADHDAQLRTVLGAMYTGDPVQFETVYSRVEDEPFRVLEGR